MTNKTELIVKKDGWPADEKTSRNCYNCLTPTSGVFVTCRKGHPLVHVSKDGRGGAPIRFNSVVGFKRLFSCCFNCPDFDNDWGKGG